MFSLLARVWGIANIPGPGPWGRIGSEACREPSFRWSRFFSDGTRMFGATPRIGRGGLGASQAADADGMRLLDPSALPGRFRPRSND